MIKNFLVGGGIFLILRHVRVYCPFRRNKKSHYHHHMILRFLGTNPQIVPKIIIIANKLPKIKIKNEKFSTFSKKPRKNLKHLQRLQTLNPQIRSHLPNNKRQKRTSTRSTSRHPSYRPVHEMTRDNACDVVYGYGIHRTQKDADDRD